jgi:death-on-curing protein
MIHFLTLEEVLKLYLLSMRRYGGLAGIRDRGLLESAIYQVKMLYQYEKSDIYTLGAAYSYYLIKNHPFIDGNKRIGALASLTFLEKNGVTVTFKKEESLYSLIMDIASSKCSIDEAASFFKKNSLSLN